MPILPRLGFLVWCDYDRVSARHTWALPALLVRINSGFQVTHVAHLFAMAEPENKDGEPNLSFYRGISGENTAFVSVAHKSHSGVQSTVQL